MKNNNHKGFTLPELLGVIVILSIILVIAVPNILNVINNAQKSAFENDIKTIIEAVKLEYETRDVENEPCPKDSESCSSSSNYRVLPRYNFGIDRKGNSLQTTSIFGILHIKGDVPSGGSIFYKSNNNDLEQGYYKKYDKDEEKTVSIVVNKLVSKNGKWCAQKEYNSDNIIIKKSKDDAECIQHIIVDGREVDLKASELYYDNNSELIKSLNLKSLNCDNAQCALDKINELLK